MKSRTSAPKTGNCEICGLQTRSLGFRVFVCKACSMYYRRTFHLRHKLRCSNDGNCQLIGTHRSNCRYCRMQMCRKVGLRMVNSSLVVQHNGFPVDDILETNVPDPYIPQSVPQTPTHSTSNSYPSSQMLTQTPSTSVCSTPSCSSNFEPVINETICAFISVQAFEGFPLLRNAAKHYHQFETRQKNLVDSYRTPNEMNLHQSIPINNTTYLRIENGNLHLLSIAIGQILQEYCTEDWVKLAKTTVIQFSLLHKLGISVRQFSKREDSRLACFFGAHVDSSDLFSYLGANYENQKNFFLPFLNVWIECTQRFKQIGPTAEELLLISIAFIFEEGTRQDCLTQTGTKLKDRLYSEFFDFLSQIYGPANASIRLIKLLTLQMDLKTLADAHLQMIEMIRVFRPNNSEYIWQDQLLGNDYLAEYQRIANEISH